MRRRSTPIGWPRRDPRHYRIAIPNAVWARKLKPAGFMIFSYLCYHRSLSQVNQPTLEMVAEGVQLSMSTTKSIWRLMRRTKRGPCRNEFVVKAVNFYADFLAGQVNGVLRQRSSPLLTDGLGCSRTG